MSGRVLIIPDKFKGTLSAAGAAEAMASGWKAVRPDDVLDLLPMSDGGDGFGEVLGRLIQALPQKIRTVNAAHQPVEAVWWWEPESGTAVIESARIVGLALLPPGRFHPFVLDTFGLGKVIQAAARRGARHCIVGVGGSATNDGGFGLARALGWTFLDAAGREIREWPSLGSLAQVQPPSNGGRLPRITVAVDVCNRLLGPHGCTRIYGPQKGLRTEDFSFAEHALKRLAAILKKRLRRNLAAVPGAGAAGGLGFGLMAFAKARPESGFGLFARRSRLKQRLRRADWVITGEGSMDFQSIMGKGVGEVARWCRVMRVPCIGLAGSVTERESLLRFFTSVHGLTDIVPLDEARRHPAKYLETLACRTAAAVSED